MRQNSHQGDDTINAVRTSDLQASLRELSEGTGGFLIANTNNTDKLLARVMEEVDTHYEIAYPPASERYDGHFRKIEVKLARPGLQVETRGGYFAVPDTGAGPLTSEEMAGLRVLHPFPYRRFRRAAAPTIRTDDDLFDAPPSEPPKP